MKVFCIFETERLVRAHTTHFVKRCLSGRTNSSRILLKCNNVSIFSGPSPAEFC